MSYSYLKKLWNETGIGAIIILLLIAYGVGVFGNYISSKSYSGSEYMTGNKTSLLGVIGLSVYYKMPIILIDNTKKTYMPFFPQNTERAACIIYKIYGKSRNNYELYTGEEAYESLCQSYFGLESYLRPLKAISTYSRLELNELADRFGILREKKSKEDVYRELSEYLVWL